VITIARSRADGSGELLRDALARRRLAADGGAYTLLLEPAAAMAGSLRGVPVAVKDLFDVAGAPTRAGSRARRDAPVAASDAAVVAAVRAAGAAIVGKTALHEFAFGTTGVNDFEGTPAHLRDPARIVGGSSSGSAVAVAEGSAAAALGTDTGGSVRIPAALCGLVGMKPSYGVVSLAGVFPLSPTLDHVGVLASDVASAREVLEVIAPTVAWSGGPPRRLGLDRGAFETADPVVARRAEQALARLGGQVLREVVLPDPELVFAVSTAIMFSEAAAGHARRLRQRAADYGRDVRERLALGGAIAARTYLAALRERETLRAVLLLLLLDEFDAIVGPTVPLVAPTREEAADPAIPGRLVRNTRLANVVGLPAVSVPIPGDGLPVGLQVLARTDAAALSAAELVWASLR